MNYANAPKTSTSWGPSLPLLPAPEESSECQAITEPGTGRWVWVPAGEYTFRSWQVKQNDQADVNYLGSGNGTWRCISSYFLLLPLLLIMELLDLTFSVLYLGAARQWEWVLWEVDLVSQVDLVEEAHTVQLDLTMRKEAEAQGGCWTCSRSHIYQPKLTWGPCLSSLSPRSCPHDTQSQLTCPSAS